MSPITTHILDTGNGHPAKGVPVILEIANEGMFEELGTGVTDADGRVKDLLEEGHKLESGIYRISFAIGQYYTDMGQKTFYPEASVVFNIEATDEHYHVPLLLSGFGYSTYRGS